MDNTYEETLLKVRLALSHLEDVSGMDRDDLLIIHTISPYDDIDDYYKIINVIKGNSMFVSDTLEDLLWNIQQMY